MSASPGQGVRAAEPRAQAQIPASLWLGCNIRPLIRGHWSPSAHHDPAVHLLIPRFPMQGPQPCPEAPPGTRGVSDSAPGRQKCQTLSGGALGM